MMRICRAAHQNICRTHMKRSFAVVYTAWAKCRARERAALCFVAHPEGAHVHKKSSARKLL